MDVGQPLAGNQSEPEVDGMAAGLRAYSAIRLHVQIGLLEHIGRVDPARQAAVEP